MAPVYVPPHSREAYSPPTSPRVRHGGSRVFSSSFPQQGSSTSSSCDLQPGFVWYLPPYSRKTDPEGKLEYKKDGFNHPVLIHSVDQAKKEANVFIISSLRGKPLEEYHSKRCIRELHIPIFPAPPHPDNGSLVHLVDFFGLEKDSHVKINQLMTVKSWVLKEKSEGWNKKPVKMQEQSFSEILYAFDDTKDTRTYSSTFSGINAKALIKGVMVVFIFLALGLVAPARAKIVMVVGLMAIDRLTSKGPHHLWARGASFPPVRRYAHGKIVPAKLTGLQ